jgi:hypothetical protein
MIGAPVQPQSHFPPPQRQGGFSLVTAIFLLVVLSALGAATLTIFAVHQNSSALDVQGARAYQAARAGMEWGVYQQLRNGSCVASSSFQLPANTTLSSFWVTVACTYTRDPVGAGGIPSPLANPILSTLAVGSALVTVPNAAILTAGMRVWGAGVPSGTVILSTDTTANTVTLSNLATLTGVSPVAYVSTLDRWSISATACNQPAAAAPRCPNPNTGPDYVERVVRVEF